MRCQAKEERVAIPFPPSPIMLIRPSPFHFLPCVPQRKQASDPTRGREGTKERGMGFDKHREVFRNKITPHSRIVTTQGSERVTSNTIAESLAIFRGIFSSSTFFPLLARAGAKGGWTVPSFVLGQERGQGWMGQVEEEEACLPLRLCSPCLPSSVYVCELLLLLPRRLEPVWAKRGEGGFWRNLF